MITFQNFIKLYEGVNDPGIFKAFFTAGGPGSGKSYVAAASGVAARAVRSTPAPREGAALNPSGLRVPA